MQVVREKLITHRGLIPFANFLLFFLFLAIFSTPSSTHHKRLGKVPRKRNEDREIERTLMRQMECPRSFKCQFDATSVTDVERWIHR